MKITRKQYLRLMRTQKLYALGILAICALCLWMCSKGQTIQDRDGTAVVLLAPLGLYLLFTKKICIYG